MFFIAFLSFGMCAEAQRPQTRLLWGDLNVQTSYSPIAYAYGNQTADPGTAYRYAKGLPVIHPYNRTRVQIRTPLDFLVVADQSELMGILVLLARDSSFLGDSRLGRNYRDLISRGRETEVYQHLLQQIADRQPEPELVTGELRKRIWQNVLDAAEIHYEPGNFSTFVAWEWSPASSGHLKRIVVSRGGERTMREVLPYTAFDSERPEDLWLWLEKVAQETDNSFIAIPQKAAGDTGRLAFDGESNLGSSSSNRLRWEPLAIVSQMTGDIESHRLISPEDSFLEYAGRIEGQGGGEWHNIDWVKPRFVRGVLFLGLELRQQLGFNPYRIGLVGATDSHTGLASAEENNFWGYTAVDSIPETIHTEIQYGLTGYDVNAAGLTAVWAEENTRDSIFQALQRREVYASTGSRISVRFFGGWDFRKRDAGSKYAVEIGYQKGVPMGSDLKIGRGNPTFLVRAEKDPQSANLDRVQIIKGWLDKYGKTHEAIYNVAVSKDRRVDKEGQVLPVSNTVNDISADYSNTVGESSLHAVWSDPAFDPDEPAFYYARVLEIPTPRHSLFDTIALGTQHPEQLPTSIQERAYTSPIWYTPPQADGKAGPLPPGSTSSEQDR